MKEIVRDREGTADPVNVTLDGESATSSTSAKSRSFGLRAGVVIPAHNEEASIARLLGPLAGDGTAGLLEIVVVCNGCTDRTAEISRSFSGVSVIEIDRPSKADAMRRGDKSLKSATRVFVDADVVIDSDAILKLVSALGGERVLASGPARVVARDDMSWAVRWYYDFWECLPQVRSGLFGRGVIALSPEGIARVRELPPIMSDDLAISETFENCERAIVEDARVTIIPPRTIRGLIRRRIRVATGNHQADRIGLRRDSSRTTVASLFHLLIRSPKLVLRLPIFLLVTIVARIGAWRAVRMGDFSTWRRDDSSRA